MALFRRWKGEGGICSIRDQALRVALSICEDAEELMQLQSAFPSCFSETEQELMVPLSAIIAADAQLVGFRFAYGDDMYDCISDGCRKLGIPVTGISKHLNLTDYNHILLQLENDDVQAVPYPRVELGGKEYYVVVGGYEFVNELNGEAPTFASVANIEFSIAPVEHIYIDVDLEITV